MGLCKRTGFLGVKRRENPVRRHFERSEMRGQHYGILGIVRWPLAAACHFCYTECVTLQLLARES